MEYRVVSRFKDVNHNRIYEVGENYPAKGEKATKTRLEHLATTKNKYKRVFIEKVEESSIDKEVEKETLEEE